MIRIEDVIDRVQENRPGADTELIRRSYMFSALHHRGQKRASGEPYLVHPIEVAAILADMRLDEVSVATGLLHDVVEDTLVDLDTIRGSFGNEIALLVDGLTKIANISDLSREKQQAENVRKMVLAMTTDVRVVLIKLADRLHNMRTMQFLKPEKRQRISQETLDIYAPIAHRLGMGKVRGELEDLAFQNLYPDEYKRLAREVDARRPELEAALEKITSTIAEKLTENEVPFLEIQGRVKRLYSLWKKLKKQKIMIEQVYDLIAARIITENDRKYCYLTMSVIHDRWTPVPERFKDWIAIPRDNLYQSLHTSVIGDGGQPFEVQIRTQEMHQVAEEGVAAHWRYKGSALGEESDEDANLDELRRVVEKLLLPLVRETEEQEDSEDFIESLKLDLYPKDVYTFTPMGKVIQLPRGASPIDFAYAIHSQVGDTCTGAKINGRIVPLRSELQNGDVVEILTKQNSKPSGDWLDHAITARARNRIRHFISQEQRTESIEIGRKLLEKEAEKFRIPSKKFVNNEDEMKRIGNEYGLSRAEDLFASIGYGKTLPRNVVAKFLGAEKFNELDPDKQKETRLKSGMKAVRKFIGLEDSIVVKGVDNLLINRAKCCNPLRGEEIVGYISLEKGIVVHNKRCKNMSQLMVNKERIVDVEWAKSDTDHIQSVQLLATTENRTGMLAGITNAIADIKTGIRDAHANVSKDDIGMIEVTVEVFDKKHLDKVVGAIEHVPGVIAVERVNA